MKIHPKIKELKQQAWDQKRSTSTPKTLSQIIEELARKEGFQTYAAMRAHYARRSDNGSTG